MIGGLLRLGFNSFEYFQSESAPAKSNWSSSLGSITGGSFFLKHINYSDYNPKVRYLHALKC